MAQRFMAGRLVGSLLVSLVKDGPATFEQPAVPFSRPAASAA